MVSIIPDHQLFNSLVKEFAHVKDFVTIILNVMVSQIDIKIVYDPQSDNYTNLFFFISQQEDIRRRILENLQSVDKMINGYRIENSYIGTLLKLSVIPRRQTYIFLDYEKFATDRIKKCRTKPQYDKTKKNLLEIYYRHIGNVHRFFVGLMRDKQFKEKKPMDLVLNFLRKSLELNQKRGTLG